MMTHFTGNKPDRKHFGPFRKAFRMQVHIMILWGYEDSIHRIKSIDKDDKDEPSITGYIKEAIQIKLSNFHFSKQFKAYYIKENEPVEKEGCTGNKRPMPDIIIESNHKGRPQYIFEAKRLRKPRFGVDKYIGLNGLGCFLDGRYAERYSEAAMLGYIQSDSLLYWKEKIMKEMDKQSEKLSLKSTPCDCKVIDAFPHEWESVHHRKDSNFPISIRHILLDYCLIEN